MSHQPKQYDNVNQLPAGVKFITGGLAACVAEAITIPLDTAKVRMQIQKPLPDGTYKYRGIFSSTLTIYKEDGMFALWKGVCAGFQRQIINASLRIGLYEPVRDFYCGKDFKGDPPLYKKVAAGLTTGCIGITVANPTDVIKIRFQVDGNLPPSERRYTNLRHAYRSIYQADGILGFWRGYVPNAMRNSIINAAELAAYDSVKQFVLNHNIMGNNIYCHLFSSFWAGFIATVVGQPVDLIKTRIMNQKQSIGFVIMDMVKNQGVLSFYNGFGANASRIVSWNIIMFVTLEQIRFLAFDTFYRGKVMAQY